MAVVFAGDHSKPEIKTQIDQVMRMYNLPITAENYQRFGSALVSLEEETGVPEMEILFCMEEADLYHTKMYTDEPPDEVVPDAAALCATQIQEQ